MGVIIPAILPSSRADLEDKLARLHGLVDVVQIDIVDGRLATPATWPYTGETKEFAAAVAHGGTLPYLGNFRYEVDLMVTDPEQVIGTWIAAGASRVTIHAESTSYLPRVITDLRVRYGHDKDFAPGLLSFGLSLNVTSELSLIEPFIRYVDYVQFMGIARIGLQGQPFDKRVLQKISRFRKRHPTTPIQVDGGVSLSVAPMLLEAGVDRLVVGSDLWKAPNLEDRLAQFYDLTQEYGIYR